MDEVNDIAKRILDVVKVRPGLGVNELLTILKGSITKPTLLKKINGLETNDLLSVDRRGKKHKIYIAPSKNEIKEKERRLRKIRGKRNRKFLTLATLLLESCQTRGDRTYWEGCVMDRTTIERLLRLKPKSNLISALKELKGRGFIEIHRVDKDKYAKIELLPFDPLSLRQ